MTSTTTSVTRWFKTNPDCPTRRHAPTMENYRRGCRCSQVMDAMQAWAGTQSLSPCPGRGHGPTNAAWSRGCRHLEAIVAHEEWKLRRKADIRTAVAHFQATGCCGAGIHGTVYAFAHGCRCPEAISANGGNVFRVEQMRVKLRAPRKLNPWREGRMAVGRTNLWMLVHGFVDDPTLGERIAATAILSERGSCTGLYDSREIADRIGVSCPEVVNRYRKRIIELREQRHLRRLADVRDKAARVTRAIERGRVG